MDIIPIVVSLMIILFGTLALTVYVLTFALRDAMGRIARINERLLILIGVRDGGQEAARALLAHTRRPRQSAGGIANAGKADKESPKQAGMNITVGTL